MLQEFLKAAQTEVVLKRWIVYVHEAPNGKRYVGITSQRLAERCGRGCGYKNNEHLYSAIKKYGWDSFSHLVVATGLLYEDACKMEQKLIAAFRSNEREYGYNKSSGGDNSSVGCHRTSEQKSVLSAKLKETWKDEDYRRRVSETIKKKGIMPPSRKGCISEKRKPVYKYTKDGVFVCSYPSIHHAADANGVTVMAISNVCRGKAKTSCGYIFSFDGGGADASRVS